MEPTEEKIADMSGRIAGVAAEANGLQISNQETEYSLWMYFTQYPEAEAPNFDHWWLDIKGICLEIFPGMKHIQVYHGHQSLIGKGAWSTYLWGLRDEHITYVRKIIRNSTRGNSWAPGVGVASGDALWAATDWPRRWS